MTKKMRLNCGKKLPLPSKSENQAFQKFVAAPISGFWNRSWFHRKSKQNDSQKKKAVSYTVSNACGGVNQPKVERLRAPMKQEADREIDNVQNCVSSA
jgi:hypothetical protein